MKKFKLFYTMIVACLLFIGSSTVFAQHFGDVQGSPINAQWTLYLNDIGIDGAQADVDDELAVFDGTTMVGVYTFTGNEDYTSTTTSYDMQVYSQLASGTGYTHDHDVTFKFWDNSASLEVTGVFNEWSAPHPAYAVLNAYDNNDYGVAEDYGDYASTVLFPDGENPYSYITLDFTSGYSVSGTITIAGSCSGAMGDVIVQAFDASDNLVGSDVPDETTGDYTINGLQDGAVYEIKASLTNYTSDPVLHLATISGSNMTGKNFTLNPFQGSIAITTKSSTTNSNIDVTVSLYDASDDTQVGVSHQTSSSGTYTFDDLCMGTYYVKATDDDYVNETSEDVELTTNAQVATVDFELDPLPGSISGQITDADGPVQGVTIHCTNTNVDPAVELFWVYSNELGYYNAPNVPAGTWTVEYEMSGYTKQTISVSVTANAITTQDVTLVKAPGILTGAVTNAVTGAFIEGVTVDILLDGLGGTSTAAGDGSYEFNPTAAGTFDVEFTKGGFITKTIEDVVINANYTTTLNVALQPNPGAIQITGVYGGATVTIGEDYTATYLGNAVYDFATIPVGTYDVKIEKGGYHTKILEDVVVVSGTTTSVPTSLLAYNYAYVSGSSFDPMWTIFLQGATIDGVPVEVNDEIAIFDGSTMVGVYYIDEALVSWTATSHQLKAYSQLNGGSGYTAGNAYTFKLWDSDAGVEYTATSVTLSDPNAEGAYTGNVFPAVDGEFSFATLQFNAEETMTYNLHTGYQIISSRVVTADMDMGTIMDGLDNKDNNLEYVKNELGQQYRKIGGTWTNNIGNWGITEGYLVKMTNDDDFDMAGLPQNAQTEIPLVVGYNLISFLPENAMNAATAFNDIKDNMDFARNSGGDNFWKIGGVWVNNIGDLNPGEGYFVKMNAADTLVYPAAKATAITVEQELQHFDFTAGDPTDAVYTVYVTGQNLHVGDEVAVFDGDKIVGANVVKSEDDAMENNINVFNVLPQGNGFTAGNNISFKVWKQINNTEYGTLEIEYVNPNGDALVDGTFPNDDEHYSIAKLDAAELTIDEENMNTLSLYPNPAHNQIRLTSEDEIDQIRILSLTGQVVFEQSVNDNKVDINTSSFEAGIYIIESTIKQRTFILRFAVR